MINSQAMSSEQIEREFNYSAAISIAKSLLSKKMITENEYIKIDMMFIQKYQPVIAKLKYVNA